MAKKEATFETKIKRLNEITSLLEDDNISIEDSIKLYEEGLSLAKECSEALTNAQLRITELKNNAMNSSSNKNISEDN